MVKLSEQREQERRTAILDAAKALFAQRGFAETSMADIVAASGVATGTVYRYFRSKDAMVMAVSEDLVGVAFDSSAGAPPALPEAIAVLFAAATDQFYGKLASQVWAKASDSPALRTMITRRHDAVRHWLACAIDGADEPGPDAMQRAEIVLCAITGMQSWLACDTAVDVETVRKRLLAIATGQ